MNKKNKEDTLSKKYFSRVISQSVGILFSFIIMGMVPRALGPAAYGNFGFLEEVFNRLKSFLDVGTSTAFFNKLSRRREENGLISFYFQFAGVVISLILLISTGSILTGLKDYIFPDQQPLYIMMAALLASFLFLKDILQKIFDAYGLTVKFEIIELIFKIVNAGLIVLLFYLGYLSLTTYFMTRYVYTLIPTLIFLITIGFFTFKIFKRKWKLSKSDYKSYSLEFIRYSHPLVTYATFGFFVAYFDRWILQTFAGSVEQGFYSLSYKVGTIIFIFSGSFTQLLGREFSIAFGDKDNRKLAELFRKFIPMLYTLTAYFILFIAVQAETVIAIFGGEEFSAALIPMMIMIFYPLHQTYGQLSGILFYATENTKMYRNIGIISMTIGLIVSYILIAPTEFFGMDLGAVGLALKMVAVQFIGVNIQLIFNCKLLKLNFFKFLLHQLAVPLIFGVTALGAKYLIHFLPAHLFVRFFVSGALYSLLILILLYLFPQIAGQNKEERDKLVKKGVSYMNMNR